MRMFRNVFTAALLVGSLTIASAATIFTVVPGGSLGATTADFGSGLQLDVRGAGFVAVGNPGFVGALGVSDSTGGTDPGFLTLPFGNAALFVSSGSGTEFGGILLDFASATVTGSQLSISGIIGALTPVTQQELALAIAESPLLFVFDQTGRFDVGGGQVTTYALSSINSAVPEPASIALAAFGLGAVALYRRKRAA